MPDPDPRERLRAVLPRSRSKTRTVPELRKRLEEALKADPIRPEVVMQRARDARKAQAITPEQFRKLEYNFGRRRG